MRAGLGLAMVAGLAFGQTAPNTATEIAIIRDRVRTCLDQMPRITCIERTRQTIRIAGAELTETREDSCDTHQYKLFAVQSMAGSRAGRPAGGRRVPLGPHGSVERTNGVGLRILRGDA